MCGITGILHCNDSPVDEALLARMCDAIRHRGPDEDGYYINGPVGMAMRRLAIIDVKGGQQPIHNESRTTWTVFNGEIYNYRELRRDLEVMGHRFYTNSDTEVIVHAYDRYGAQCPKYLHGMFAFAIWDETKQKLLLARDRVGKKPLLYAWTGRELIFGSEFAAVLLHPSISRDISYEAIHYYLTFMCVPAPLTAYKSIRKLEPGHTLQWSPDGNINIERYWQPNFSNKLRITEEEAGEQVVEHLREAVRVRLMSEVPLGAFLSGGIDSSAVVALMSEQTSGRVKTFSIGFDEQDFSELHHARRVAEHVGSDHHEFIVRPDAMQDLPTLVEHYGEPYADSSAIPTYYVARETRKHVTVALNGDGGDETFGGYERYAAMNAAEIYRSLPKAFRRSVIEPGIKLFPSPSRHRNPIARAKRFISSASLSTQYRYLSWMSVFDRAAKKDLYSEGFWDDALEWDPAAFFQPWFASTNGSGMLDAVLLTDTMTYLPNDLLVKVDIASMAVSLEARSPFLDHRVIEFAASLPSRLKLRGLTTKYLLKKAFRNLVPAENLSRPKMGFGVPIGHWFRGRMQGFLRQTLLSQKALDRGFFKSETVTRMVEQHARGKEDYAHQLWTLLMLELWFQRFID